MALPNIARWFRPGPIIVAVPKEGPPKAMTIQERAVGWATGRGLLWLLHRAAKRGDWHEFNHVQTALIGGNSSHTRTPCGLPPVATERPLRLAGMSSYPVGSTPPGVQP
jgi:hypothetical protein